MKSSWKGVVEKVVGKELQNIPRKTGFYVETSMVNINHLQVEAGLQSSGNEELRIIPSKGKQVTNSSSGR